MSSDLKKIASSFGKKAESRLKAAQSQAGKTLKAAQKSQAAKNLRASQTRVVNKLSGRSDSTDNSSLDSRSRHGSMDEFSSLDVDDPFDAEDALDTTHHTPLPPSLRNQVALDFSGDPQSSTYISEKEAQQQQSRNIVHYIRDDWIRQQMKDREHEYTNYTNATMFIGTWNVNGKKPNEPLEPWLGVPSDQPLPDIYVVGFQEIVDLNAANVVSDSSSKERSQSWKIAIGESINGISRQHHAANKLDGEPQRYLHLAERHLVGIMVCVFVLERHRSHVHDVQSTTAATGVMGVMGNKGGASVRLRFYDSTLCFVCAHMAAHRDNVEGRNSDFHNIMGKISFKDEAMSLASRSIPPEFRQITSRQVPGGLYGIRDHDFVVWLGDFNYRMDVRHSVEDVYKRVDSLEFDWLQSQDQLNIERKAGRVFQGFKEHPLQFLPTYKYIVGTQMYDRRPEKKMRAPAWCDRILYCAPTSDDPIDEKHPEHNNGPIKMLCYARADLTCSDHKPVLGIMQAKVKHVIVQKQKDVITDIVRTLDRWENENIPKLRLSATALTFDSVKYRVPTETSFTVSNEGTVPAVWRFVPKMDDQLICKSWLNVSKEYGMLLPGKSETIKVSCFVGVAMARAVQSGIDFLDEILIFRVEKGRDHFISISAVFQPTCYGRSIAALVRNPFPVRIQDDIRQDLVRSREKKLGREAASQPLPLPKEVWRLVNHLHLYGGYVEPHIFMRPGVRSEINQIRDVLDTGMDIPPPPSVHLNSVAGALVELLHSFADPVVPAEFCPWSDFDAIPVHAWASRFLEQLPAMNYNLFVYIILFLRELLKPSNTSRSKIHPDKLGILFASALFKTTAANQNAKDGSVIPSPPVRLLFFFFSSAVLPVGRNRDKEGAPVVPPRGRQQGRSVAL